MNPHPLLPHILLHSDEELAQALGARIVKQKTVHQWPLCCVQRLLLDDGRKLFYKSQLTPTVKGQFYSKALSPLLPSCHVLDKAGDCDIMKME